MNARLIIAAIVLALGFGAGWKIQGWRWDSAEKARLEHEAEVVRQRARVADTASAGHETDKTEIRTEFVTITKEVDRVVEKSVYRNVCLDPDGLQLLGRAIGGEPAPGQPAGAVPGPEQAR